jgi:hypothetical protein
MIKSKKFVTMIGVFALLLTFAVFLGQAAALEPDARVLPRAVSISPNEVDTSSIQVKVTKFWLSDEKWGETKITKVRPGEWIYGVYNTILSGEGTILDREYAIDMYGFSYTLSGYWAPQTLLFSWGFQIPMDRAKNNDKPIFYHSVWASGGNWVVKKKTFTVLRDGYVNANRAYMETMTPELKTQILTNVGAAGNYLKYSPLLYKTTFKKSSPNAASFLNDLIKRRPTAALVHSHGSSVYGGIIMLKDETWFDATALAASGFKAPPGLFYAAVCEGAASSTLGNAFITAGYTAFIGYTVSVYTTRNADFYEYFFDLATYPDVSVASALASTISWANGKGWTDVATAKIIGSGANLYLGGKTTTMTAQKDEMESPTPVQVTGWRDVAAAEMTVAESEALNIADQVDEVRALKDKYGDALTTGIEVFPNVNRVSYKLGNRFLFGVDIDKVTGIVVDQGPLD